MRDPYDSGSLFPVLVVAAAYVVTLILARMGIANKNTANTIAKVLAVLAGLTYAIVFEFERSFGPFADALLRIVFGAVVAGVLWVFILVGVGAVTDAGDKQSNQERKG